MRAGSFLLVALALVGLAACLTLALALLGLALALAAYVYDLWAGLLNSGVLWTIV